MIFIKYPLVLLSIVIQFGCTTNDRTLPKTGTIQEFELLEAFLNDPLATFDEIKRIPDLCERIFSYDLNLIAQRSGIKPYLVRLFERNFQDINQDKLRIVIYLFLKLRICQGDISDMTMTVFNLQPALFVMELEKTKEWKILIKSISQNWESFSLGLSELGSSAFEKEVKAYALSLYEAKLQGLNDIEAFINDPITNFDRIKKLGDIGDWIGEYEQRFVKDRIQTKDVLKDFFNHFTEISEKKIEILVYLIQNSGSGMYGEIFVGKAEEVFCNQPKLFVRVLERNIKWKEVIYQLAVIGGISRCLEKLGDSRFEMKIKAYIKEISNGAASD